MSISALMSANQTLIAAGLADAIAVLPSQPARLRDAMHYSLTQGGKRIRPQLVYLTGNMLGACQQDLTPLAVAVECIHAYSLVHDDLPAMDDDDLRRGKPTCHIAFDEATAILAGDALQTLAFDTLLNSTLSPASEPQRIDVIRQLSAAAGFAGMCGGQAMDLDATDKHISLDALATLHRKKTGALIRAAVLMPAVLTKQAEPVLDALHQFADSLGLAFQVQDDILDITSDTETLGKPQGSDLENHKSTYPALLGLAGAKAHAQQLFDQALHALDALPYNTQQLKEFAGLLINRNN